MKTAFAALLVAAPLLGSATPAHAAACNVDVVDNAYDPGSLHVAPGATVTWCWTGSNEHTVTGDDGLSSPQQSSGQYPHTFATAGTYKYHCKVHDFMHGTVVVGTPSPTPSKTKSPTPNPTTTQPTTPAPQPTRTRTPTPTPMPTSSRTTSPPAPTTAPASTDPAPTTSTSRASAEPAASSRGNGLPLALALLAATAVAGGGTFALRRWQSR